MQAGRAVGIEFRWGGMIGGTREAHRVIWLCQRELELEGNGRGVDVKVRDALVEGIFEAYHVREEDISDLEVLRRVAVDAGVDAGMVDGWLGSDVGGKAVDEEAERNRSVTTAGVPFFTIQGEYHVDGVQDLQEFFEVFVKVREAEDRKDV